MRKRVNLVLCILLTGTFCIADAENDTLISNTTTIERESLIANTTAKDDTLNSNTTNTKSSTLISNTTTAKTGTFSSKTTTTKAPKLVCNGPNELRLNAKFGNEFHWLCLREVKIATSSLLAKNSVIFVDSTRHQSLYKTNITMVAGYTIGEKPVGSADGYLTLRKDFVGKLQYFNRTIYADTLDSEELVNAFGKFFNDHTPPPPKSRRNRDLNLVVDDMFFDNTTADAWSQMLNFDDHERSGDQQGRERTGREEKQSVPVYVFKEKKKTKQTQKKLPLPEYIVRPAVPNRGTAKARLCELLILADHWFYKEDANSSWEQATKLMFNAISLADMIFRNTDFDEDGNPDNVGFAVKYAIVLTSLDTHHKMFGKVHPHSQQDGRDYLMKFAALKKLGEVCLGVAFTGHSFKNKSIGLSFTSLGDDEREFSGGICDHSAAGLSYNILAVAHGGHGAYGKRVPARLAGLALAHEMGHSFGAHHDETFAQQSCHHHLMSQESLSGNLTSHYKFSACSRRQIREVIDRGGSCMVHDDRPYCGNGIVEGDEACDCGLPSSCAATDACCTPRTGASAGFIGDRSVHVSGCSVSPGAMCHPSQGGCCHKNCTFADFSKDGLDCTRMHEKCPCATEQSRCACGLGGECLSDGKCVAAECARLGLRECTCPRYGPGGVVGAEKRCGVCCVLPAMQGGEEECASAETAAKKQLELGLVSLAELRDDEYTGPNVFFRLCLSKRRSRDAQLEPSEGCAVVFLRAWKPRGACAVHGELGECLPSGVCAPPARPIPNIYPLLENKYLPLEGPFKVVKSENAASPLTQNVHYCSTLIVLQYIVMYTSNF